MTNCFQETDDDKLYCAPCFKQTNSQNFPLRLRAYLKGNFGIFNKPNAPNFKTNKERKKRMLDHCRSEIHEWCIAQEKISSVESEIEKKANERSAEIVVTSAIECILELDGSQKFLRLNNMLESLMPSEYPTKNDGRQMYYTIRDITFDTLTSKIKQQFKSVKNACFTLDKVTVRRTPFTVIMTYFSLKEKFMCS